MRPVVIFAVQAVHMEGGGAVVVVMHGEKDHRMEVTAARYYVPL